MIQVTLYGRPGCGLCDEAREGLEALREGSGGFALREVDVDEDRALRARYLERLPVVEIDGEVVCELGLDATAVRTRLDTVSQ